MMQSVYNWLDMHSYAWPVFIILARIIDVSIGTVRTICVVRGDRTIAALLGFCEVTIWIVAVSGVLKEITALKVLSYGLGFAAGNAVGVWLEEKLALGQQLIFMISRGKAHAVAFALRLANFLVTEVPAQGGQGEVALCFAVTPRKRTHEIIQIAKTVDESVFVVVEDVRHHNRPPQTHETTGWRALLKKK